MRDYPGRSSPPAHAGLVRHSLKRVLYAWPYAPIDKKGEGSIVTLDSVSNRRSGCRPNVSVKAGIPRQGRRMLRRAPRVV